MFNYFNLVFRLSKKMVSSRFFLFIYVFNEFVLYLGTGHSDIIIIFNPRRLIPQEQYQKIKRKKLCRKEDYVLNKLITWSSFLKVALDVGPIMKH